MKTIRMIVLLSIIAITMNYAQSQRVVVTNDSLKIHFQKEESFKVFDYLASGEWDIDYKILYYDKEMKDYLMTWFDVNVWIDYESLLYKRNLLKQFLYMPDDKENFTKYYVKNTLKINYDTISSDTLINFYFNQAIKKWEDKQKEELLKKAEELLPPWGILHIHSKIAYPESYKKLKALWNKHNKLITCTNFGRFCDLFIALLMMNDPEVQMDMNRIINKFVETNGESGSEDENRELVSCLGSIENAYSLKKLIEILPIQKKIAGLSGTDGTSYLPLDYFIYNELKKIFMKHSIDVSLFSHSITQTRKNKSKIIKAAQPLINKLEEKEKYWMDNMPFNKNN
jgi:hypothetical protein